MIFTVLDIFALAFVIVVLAWAFFFAGPSRKPTRINAAFLIVMAILLSFQLFESRLPIDVRRPAMLVIGLGVLTASVLYGLEWWKSQRESRL